MAPDFTMEDEGFASRVGNWASHPFRSDMDLLGWLLFVGLLIAACVFWRLVLKEIVEI